MTAQRSYRYYEFVMAAFVTLIICSNLVGPAKIAQIDAPLLGTLTFGSPQWRPWVLDLSSARPLFHRAVELGINFFDTADTFRAARVRRSQDSAWRKCSQGPGVKRS